MGLQRALAALSKYNISNELIINKDKTKVLVFGKRKNKVNLKWQLGKDLIVTCKKYKYLGVWFSENSRASTQIAGLKNKAFALMYALCRLHGNLNSPSAVNILKVTKSVLLPSLQHGHLAYPGLLDTALDAINYRMYKKLFSLPP